MIKNNGARATRLGVATLLLFASAAARAQDGAAGRPRLGLLESVYTTLLFGILGIVLTIIGFKLFDVVIRHNMENEILENKNMAAALLAGAVILGISLIVAATILS